MYNGSCPNCSRQEAIKSGGPGCAQNEKKSLRPGSRRASRTSAKIGTPNQRRTRSGWLRKPAADTRRNTGLGKRGQVASRVARGDVRLYQFSHPDKKRPVLVLTRNSAISYLATVTVAPITSTIRGVPSEVVLDEADGMKSACAVNLHNLVTVSREHVGRRVAQLSPMRMAEICAALQFSLGCDSI